MSESATTREINAVHSEYKKNELVDHWRIAQLMKSLGNKEHPNSNFTTGDIRTLSEIPQSHNVDLRQALLKFHGDHYSSNIMKLAVMGAESLDTLQSWVTEFFSEVPNKNAPVQVPLKGPAFLPENLGIEIKA